MRRALLVLLAASLPPAAGAQLVTTAKIQPESAPAANGLTRTLVAQQPLLKNPIAVSVDVDGKIFVTETTRRKVADLDIRDHRDWIPADLRLTSIDEKRAFLSQQQKLWPQLTKTSEKVHLLEDTDGDGMADRSTVFAEGFNTPVTGIAAGVLARRGQVFATIAPDVWHLRDTNGDGVADQRESIVTGFGLHIAYGGHDMHGLTFGPDGRLYWSIGDKGTNVLSKEGKRWFYPHEGAVLRCFPDGSGFEVFAHGLRNVQQFAFDTYGNILAVDNDADFPGEKERFVYITEGSDSGWRMFYQHRGKQFNPWMDEHMTVPARDGQLAYFTPPQETSVDGPSGFAFNPGTALNQAYKDTFFVTQFPAGKLVAFKTTPDGAGFRTTHQHVAMSGPATTGCAFGPDGALYIADWKGGYPLKEAGAVWRLDDPTLTNNPARREVAALLRDGPGKASDAELLARLGHADQRVRLDAQWELARRGRSAELAKVAADPSASQLARIHAIWGVSQTRAKLASLLAGLAKDPDAEIRAQAARWAGDAGLCEPAALIPLINDPSPRVAHLAAIAAGKLALPGCLPAVVRLLEQAPPRDRILFHSAASALAGAASATELAALASHASTPVRLAAVVALRRQQSPELAKFLGDKEPAVAAEALAAIYSDWIVQPALPAAAAALERADLPEGAIRRAMAANRRLADATAAGRLANFAADSKRPEPLRLAAIELLASWPEPIELDPADGRASAIAPADAQTAATAARSLLTKIPAAASRLAEATQAMATKLGIPLDPAVLLAELNNPAASPQARAAALETLVKNPNPAFPVDPATILAGDSPELRATAARLFATSQPAVVTTYLRERAIQSNHPGEAQHGVRLLGTLATTHAPAEALLTKLLTTLRDGAAPPHLQLDILRAAETAGPNRPALAGLLAQAQEKLKAAGPLGTYQLSLHGGSADRGERVFTTHSGAQCTLCHRVAKEGSEVGPPLTTVAARHDRAYLLESLLNPQAVVAPGYGFATVARTDGTSVTGTLVAESPGEVTLATPEGKQVTIPTATIASRTGPLSTMPPMGATLTLEELRDLVAFLASLK